MRGRHTLGHRTAFPPVVGLIRRVQRAAAQRCAEDEQRRRRPVREPGSGVGRFRIVVHNDHAPGLPFYVGDLDTDDDFPRRAAGDGGEWPGMVPEETSGQGSDRLHETNRPLPALAMAEVVRDGD